MFKGNNDILKVAFDTTLEGILLTDSQANIVMANIAVERCLGYKVDELLGKNIGILVPNFLREIHKDHYKTYFKTSDNFSHQNAREINGQHKDGRLIPLEVRLSSFEYEGNKYAKALITDITERKEKEEKIKVSKMELEEKVKDKTNDLEKVVQELRKTNSILEEEILKKKAAQNKAKQALVVERELGQLKTRFISLASHEFRTPLSGILTSATLIKKYTEQNNNNILKHADTIQAMVKHLSNILDDFLSLERIETGSIQYKFSNFSIDELLLEIIEKANSLTKNGQYINYKPCKNCPDIYSDKKMINIIITNVLFNAIKYSPEKSKISIGLSKSDYILIKVTDTGIGIPKIDQDLIFTRFFRGSNTGNIQGTGIGLNIVKANIESLGGFIDFESKENGGTCFIIKIPLDSSKIETTENISKKDLTSIKS